MKCVRSLILNQTQNDSYHHLENYTLQADWCYDKYEDWLGYIFSDDRMSIGLYQRSDDTFNLNQTIQWSSTIALNTYSWDVKTYLVDWVIHSGYICVRRTVC
jgi:hypothetical protein